MGNTVNNHNNTNHDSAFLPSINSTSHVGAVAVARQQSPFDEQLNERQRNNDDVLAARNDDTSPSALTPRSVELMTLDNVPPLDRARQDDDFEVVVRNFLQF